VCSCSSVFLHLPLNDAMAVLHPLDPLSHDELTEAASLISSHVRNQLKAESVYIKFIILLPPPKRDLVPFLDDLAREGELSSPFARRVEALLGLKLAEKSVVYFEVGSPCRIHTPCPVQSP
jgi:Cu2+-containing amine oxidase